MRARFGDREDAGRQLAPMLEEYRGLPGAIVLGLPRGGVPVAAAVAEALQLPLDVLCVRKLGVPYQRELAMGAIASGGAVVRNEAVLAEWPAAMASFARVLEEERGELARRERAYRGSTPPLQFRDRSVILVDDGLATGATMEAAVKALRSLHAEGVVVAVPVASPEARDRITALADHVIVGMTPGYFGSVGEWYRTFDQTSDAEVTRLLARFAMRHPAGSAPASL